MGAYSNIIHLKLQDYCTSNHCSIVNFDLTEYPPHIQKDSSLIRPLIIQVSSLACVD